MSQPFELSLEQQFNVRSFQTQIQEMSREQAQDFLVKLYTQMIWQESTYKNLLKHQWGLEGSPALEQ
jgi:Phycobilisome degradation protein nblA